MQAFLRFLIKSIIYGLALAFVLLIAFPDITGYRFQAFSATHKTIEPAPFSYAKAVHRAAPAVVNVYTVTTLVDPRAFRPRIINRNEVGSGVIMNEQGYILTNYHVVYGADNIEVVLQDGRLLNAVLIGLDELTDLALLYVQADNLPVIPQDPDLEPQVGDVVLAIGNPLNLGQTVTQGIISANGVTGLSSTGYKDFMRMDAAINAGNSGGALVNSNGTLVGINAAVFQFQDQDTQGIFFAIPYKLANNIMQKLIKHGRVTRSHLGVDGHAVLNAEGERLFSTGQKLYGLMIDAVRPTGAAYAAGIQVGDIILKIDETPFIDTQQALDLITETPPGTTITLTVNRSGQILLVPVALTEMK